MDLGAREKMVVKRDCAVKIGQRLTQSCRHIPQRIVRQLTIPIVNGVEKPAAAVRVGHARYR